MHTNVTRIYRVPAVDVPFLAPTLTPSEFGFGKRVVSLSFRHYFGLEHYDGSANQSIWEGPTLQQGTCCGRIFHRQCVSTDIFLHMSP